MLGSPFRVDPAQLWRRGGHRHLVAAPNREERRAGHTSTTDRWLRRPHSGKHLPLIFAPFGAPCKGFVGPGSGLLCKPGMAVGGAPSQCVISMKLPYRACKGDPSRAVRLAAACSLGKGRLWPPRKPSAGRATARRPPRQAPLLLYLLPDGTLRARRKPRLSSRLPGSTLLRYADRQSLLLTHQLPPRYTRFEPSPPMAASTSLPTGPRCFQHRGRSAHGSRLLSLLHAAPGMPEWLERQRLGCVL
jgi:hypothetical protein